jgi:hypothetical protein
MHVEVFVFPYLTVITSNPVLTSCRSVFDFPHSLSYARLCLASDYFCYYCALYAEKRLGAVSFLLGLFAYLEFWASTLLNSIYLSESKILSNIMTNIIIVYVFHSNCTY